MVESIIAQMYKNTDESDILIINGWSAEPEETLCIPRFYRCRMNWDIDSAHEIAQQAGDICDALESLGRQCACTGTDIFTKPDPDEEYDNDIILKVWEMFFGGYDHENTDADALAELAEKRLGGKVCAYNTFISARRVQKVIQLGAPEVVVDNERYNFARFYALTKACEKIVCADITKDRFDSKTQMLGEFDKSDVRRVFELINSDCTVMPDEIMGCTLLVNEIFGMQRLDIYRRGNTLRHAVDAALETLSQREKEILQRLYGLNDGVRKAYDTTALEMRLPVPVVIYCEAAAMCKLRYPARQAMLERLIYEPRTDGKMTELDAFNADLRLAQYMARVENDELTEEELKTRIVMFEDEL